LGEELATYLRSKSAMTLATYKTLMKVYACGGQYGRACDLYEEVLAMGLKPDAVMYGCLVKFAVKCGRTELSQALFEKAGGGFVQNYMWLIRAAGREGNAQKAVELLRRLQASDPGSIDAMVYNCVLDACIISGDTERADEIVQEMRGSCPLNLITYNTLMKGHCNKGDLKGAWKIFAEMEQAGFSPDSASFNCLISAAVANNDLPEAFSIIKKMDSGGVPLDQYTVSIMMKASRRATDYKQAMQALEVIDRCAISVCEDEVLFNTVLDACIMRKDLTRLARSLDTYAESSMRPSVRTYGLIIKGCSVLNQTQRCWLNWQQMLERGILPNDITLSCMLDALIEGHQTEDAYTLFKEYKDKVQYNTIIYSTLIKGFASAGDGERAMETYRDMQAAGVQMNLVAYTALIDSQARSGQAQEATALLRKMEEDGCEPNIITYSNVLKGHCVNGDLESAIGIFREMLGKGLKPDSVIFNTLLDGCVRHSNFDLADRVLEEMASRQVDHSNFTLSIVVKMWGKRRRLDDAFKAVRARLHGPRNFGVVDALVGAGLVGTCFQNRDPDRALEALQEMKDEERFEGPDVNTYSVMVCGLSRHGRLEEAIRIASEAADLPSDRKGARRGKGPAVIVVMGLLGQEPLRQLVKAIHARGLKQELAVPFLERLHAKGARLGDLW